MYIYHTEDGHILGMSRDNNMSYGVPFKVTWFNNPPVDVNYDLYLFNGAVFSENIPAFKEYQKNAIKDGYQKYINSGYLCKLTNYYMDADITDVLKLKSARDLVIGIYPSDSDWSKVMTEIRDYNNVSHQIDLDTLWVLIRSVGLHYSEALARKSALQRQIDEADSVQDIVKVSWSFSFDIMLYQTILAQ